MRPKAERETEPRSAFARLGRDRNATTAIEYALIASVISLAIIAGALLLGGSLEDLFMMFGTVPAWNN